MNTNLDKIDTFVELVDGIVQNKFQIRRNVDAKSVFSFRNGEEDEANTTLDLVLLNQDNKPFIVFEFILPETEKYIDELPRSNVYDLLQKRNVKLLNIKYEKIPSASEISQIIEDALKAQNKKNTIIAIDGRSKISRRQKDIPPVKFYLKFLAILTIITMAIVWIGNHSYYFDMFFN